MARGNKKKRTRDPARPKRAMTAFLYYACEQRRVLKDKNENFGTKQICNSRSEPIEKAEREIACGEEDEVRKQAAELSIVIKSLQNSFKRFGVEEEGLKITYNQTATTIRKAQKIWVHPTHTEHMDNEGKCRRI